MPRPSFDPDTIDTALRSTRPYVVSVLGDSTSQLEDGWVYLVSDRIAAGYNRIVTVHDWDDGTNTYSGTHVFGRGAAVTVWNGSARGKPAQYCAERYPQMAPEPVDLTIINHSHNNPWGAVAGVGELVDLAYSNTRPGGGVVVILQNPRTGPDVARAEIEQQAVDRLRTIYRAPDTGVVDVDVNAAFRRGDLSVLLAPDGVHPSRQGSRLWADTVIARLGLR